MQPLQNCIGPAIRIGREILCLPYAGFFRIKFKWQSYVHYHLQGLLSLSKNTAQTHDPPKHLNLLFIAYGSAWPSTGLGHVCSCLFNEMRRVTFQHGGHMTMDRLILGP